MGAVAELLGEARQRLRQAGLPSDSVDWDALLDGALPELVRAGDSTTPRAILDAAAPG